MELQMILKYNLSDNLLEKKDPTDFPNHLQDNIVLEFDKDEELPNTKYYAHIRTPDAVKKVRIRKRNGKYICDLPPFVSHNTFFKLQIMSLVDEKRFVSNELIIPFKTIDYLGYNRETHKMFHPRYPYCDDEFPHKPRHHHHHHHGTHSDGGSSSGSGTVPVSGDYYNKEELDNMLSSKADTILTSTP